MPAFPRYVVLTTTEWWVRHISKPVFADFSQFSGRRNRKRYLLVSLAQIAAFVVVLFVMGVAVAAMLQGHTGVATAVIAVAALPKLALGVSS